MIFSSIVALFGAMIALAIVPSISVLTVMSRAATWGLSHRLATVVGIVVGNFVWIILAIYGLTAVAENRNSILAISFASALQAIAKYSGGGYLIALNFYGKILQLNGL